MSDVAPLANGSANRKKLAISCSLAVCVLFIAFTLGSRFLNQNNQVLAQKELTDKGTEGSQTVAESGNVAFSEIELNSEILTVSIRKEINVDRVGNARIEVSVRLPKKDYNQFIQMMSPFTVAFDANGNAKPRYQSPTMSNVLGFLDFTTSADLIEDVAGSFDDAAATMKVSYYQPGWATRKDGVWERDFGSRGHSHYRIVRRRDETLLLESREEGNQFRRIVQVRLRLPNGASGVDLPENSNKLVYKAPAPVQRTGAPTTPSWKLDQQPHVLSALYKIYGDPQWNPFWIARSVFRNVGTEVLTDYRIRFRLAGYSDWSRWERSDVVYPGQVVTNAFYPVIHSNICTIRSTTPADIEAEMSYVRSNGERVTDTHSERTKILGINEGVWSNAPDENSSWYQQLKNADVVVSSFVSASDPVIQDVLGMISKHAGGVPTSESDEAALRFAEGLYNLFRSNIAYETSKGGGIDGLFSQHIKFGRDVLRTRSGTCVNLAILYVSVLEAAGLRPYIILVPGHAFPAFELPVSKQMVYVEATGCKGGTIESSLDFVRALDWASKTCEMWSQLGFLKAVDIMDLRKRGVNPPELPDLGINPLKEWQIVMRNPPDVTENKPATLNAGSELPLAKSLIVGVWDVIFTAPDGKTVPTLSVFRTNGTFCFGANLAKPLIEGTYSFENGVLSYDAIINNRKFKENARVLWSEGGDGLQFNTTDGHAFSLHRRSVKANIVRVWQEHNREFEGKKGVKIHVHAQIGNCPGLPCQICAYFLDSNGHRMAAPGKEGQLHTSTRLVPVFDFTDVKDVILFMPYEDLGAASNSKVKFVVHVYCERDKKYVGTDGVEHSFTLGRVGP